MKQQPIGQLETVLHNLDYHRPELQETQRRMEEVREAARIFAEKVWVATEGTPCPREQAMAFRAIEDATMYAIAGLARHEPHEYPERPL